MHVQNPNKHLIHAPKTPIKLTASASWTSVESFLWSVMGQTDVQVSSGKVNATLLNLIILFTDYLLLPSTILSIK